MNDSEENILKRRYVSGLAALILLAYTGYIIYRKLKFGAVNLDNTDFWVLGICLAVLLVIEAVKYWIKKRAGINENG